MRKIAVACLILGLGLLATLLSGLYARDMSNNGVKDIVYGLPFSWYGRQGISGSDSISVWISWGNFAFDVASWSFVFGLLASFTIGRKLVQEQTYRKQNLPTRSVTECCQLSVSSIARA